MPEQKDAAHASDSKEAHTDIHQAPNNVSHTGEVATADDSSVVKCGEGPCDAGGSAASARSDAGEVMRSTAADLHPCKKGIVVISGNLRLYPVDSFFPAEGGRAGRCLLRWWWWQLGRWRLRCWWCGHARAWHACPAASRPRLRSVGLFFFVCPCGLLLVCPGGMLCPAASRLYATAAGCIDILRFFGLLCFSTSSFKFPLVCWCAKLARAQKPSHSPTTGRATWQMEGGERRARDQSAPLQKA